MTAVRQAPPPAFSSLVSFGSGIEGRPHSGYLVGALDAQVCAFRKCPVLPRGYVILG